MVLSALTVVRAVWQIKPVISPTLAWVPATQDDELGLTMFANSITLTPGTVSVLVEEQRMLVHALAADGIKELQQGKMDTKVSCVTNEVVPC